MKGAMIDTNKTRKTKIVPDREERGYEVTRKKTNKERRAWIKGTDKRRVLGSERENKEKKSGTGRTDKGREVLTKIRRK